ncbi:MAG: phosphoribosyltransferase-like protein, partial [Dehalococcoidia bacterium]
LSYELGLPKLERLFIKLNEWVNIKGYDTPVEFENIFLIDDFSGSGNSMLRCDNGSFNGKLFKFVDDLFGADNKLGKYCGLDGPNVYIVTYIATEKSVINLRQNIVKLKDKVGSGKFRQLESMEPLQMIANTLMVPQTGNPVDIDFEKLLKKYYDDRLEDMHTETGGPDVMHGYAHCSLPLVLCHNCPNNSVYLLWGQTEKTEKRPGLKALFPRISRHLESR